MDRLATAALGLFLGIAAASLIWTPFLDDGVLEFAYLLTFAGAVWLGLLLEDLRCVFLAATLGIGLSSLIAISQWMGFNPVISLTPRPSGLFLNANILAETAALVFVGLIVQSANWRQSHPFVWSMAALGTAPSLLLPMHRGSMIALGIAGTIWLLAKLKKCDRLGAEMRTIVGITGLFFVLSILTLRFLWSWKPLASVEERLTIWRAAFDGLSITGHGAGSFRGLFAIYAAPYTDTLNLSALHAHNDLLELAFNYGIFAALPVLGVALILYRTSSPLRYVVVVFLVEGCFEFPLYMPATSMLAAIALGACIRDRSKFRIGQPRSGMDLLAGHDHAR